MLLGVLFDIDGLDGGLYGYKAYKTLFAAVEASDLAGCTLSDGDTRATLAGQKREYCIAVECSSAAHLARVRQTLLRSNAPGLLPSERRFIIDAAAVREPLIRVLGRGSGSAAALTGIGTTVGRSAAYALGEIGDVQAIAPLMHCLGSGDIWLSMAAGSALSAFGEVVVDPLLTALESSNAHVRAEAALLIGFPSDKTAIPPARCRAPLIAALRDPEWAVRKRAAESLGKFRDPGLVPILVGMMADESEGVRRGALAGLRLTGGPVAKQALAKYGKKWWQVWKWS